MDKDLKGELTCPVCMDLFCEPLRLGCGHSYCRQCLRSMERRSDPSVWDLVGRSVFLSCPECRRVFYLPDNGVDSFPIDFKLSKLVDVFQKMEGTTNQQNNEQTTHRDGVGAEQTTHQEGVGAEQTRDDESQNREQTIRPERENEEQTRLPDLVGVEQTSYPEMATVNLLRTEQPTLPALNYSIPDSFELMPNGEVAREADSLEVSQYSFSLDPAYYVSEADYRAAYDSRILDATADIGIDSNDQDVLSVDYNSIANRRDPRTIVPLPVPCVLQSLRERFVSSSLSPSTSVDDVWRAGSDCNIYRLLEMRCPLSEEAASEPSSTSAHRMAAAAAAAAAVDISRVDDGTANGHDGTVSDCERVERILETEPGLVGEINELLELGEEMLSQADSILNTVMGISASTDGDMSSSDSTREPVDVSKSTCSNSRPSSGYARATSSDGMSGIADTGRDEQRFSCGRGIVDLIKFRTSEDIAADRANLALLRTDRTPYVGVTRSCVVTSSRTRPDRSAAHGRRTLGAVNTFGDNSMDREHFRRDQTVSEENIVNVVRTLNPISYRMQSRTSSQTSMADSTADSCSVSGSKDNKPVVRHRLDSGDTMYDSGDLETSDTSDNETDACEGSQRLSDRCRQSGCAVRCGDIGDITHCDERDTFNCGVVTCDGSRRNADRRRRGVKSPDIYDITSRTDRTNSANSGGGYYRRGTRTTGAEVSPQGEYVAVGSPYGKLYITGQNICGGNMGINFDSSTAGISSGSVSIDEDTTTNVECTQNFLDRCSITSYPDQRELAPCGTDREPFSGDALPAGVSSRSPTRYVLPGSGNECTCCGTTEGTVNGETVPEDVSSRNSTKRSGNVDRCADNVHITCSTLLKTDFNDPTIVGSRRTCISPRRTGCGTISSTKCGDITCSSERETVCNDKTVPGDSKGHEIKSRLPGVETIRGSVKSNSRQHLYRASRSNTLDKSLDNTDTNDIAVSGTVSPTKILGSALRFVGTDLGMVGGTKSDAARKRLGSTLMSSDTAGVISGRAGLGTISENKTNDASVGKRLDSVLMPLVTDGVIPFKTNLGTVSGNKTNSASINRHSGGAFRTSGTDDLIPGRADLNHSKPADSRRRLFSKNRKSGRDKNNTTDVNNVVGEIKVDGGNRRSKKGKRLGNILKFTGTKNIISRTNVGCETASDSCRRKSKKENRSGNVTRSTGVGTVTCSTNVGYVNSERKSDGNRRHSSGSSRQSSGSRRNSSESRRNSGESRRNSGESRRNSGESRRNSGESRRNSGESSRNSGESRQSPGKGRQDSGESRRTGGLDKSSCFEGVTSGCVHSQTYSDNRASLGASEVSPTSVIGGGDRPISDVSRQDSSDGRLTSSGTRRSGVSGTTVSDDLDRTTAERVGTVSEGDTLTQQMSRSEAVHDTASDNPGQTTPDNSTGDQ